MKRTRTKSKPTKHEAKHSPDFASIRWTDGKLYVFTAAQRPIVKLLWEAWENETPELSGDWLVATADIGRDTARVTDIFRNSPGWNVVVVPGSCRGSYRINFSP